MVDCDLCEAYLFRDGVAGFLMLQGACASVGIEHGKSTGEMLALYVSDYHRSGHVDARLRRSC